MKRASVSANAIRDELLKNKTVREEYDRLNPRFEIISQIIAERKKQNITQSELAKRSGTYTSNISRLESGAYNPSLDFLERIAYSLGKQVHIQLK